MCSRETGRCTGGRAARLAHCVCQLAASQAGMLCAACPAKDPRPVGLCAWLLQRVLALVGRAVDLAGHRRVSPQPPVHPSPERRGQGAQVQAQPTAQPIAVTPSSTQARAAAARLRAAGSQAAAATYRAQQGQQPCHSTTTWMRRTAWGSRCGWRSWSSWWATRAVSGAPTRARPSSCCRSWRPRWTARGGSR